jgi:hypothetical protein
MTLYTDMNSELFRQLLVMVETRIEHLMDIEQCGAVA